MFSFFFNELLYRPLFNVLIFLYQTVSFGDLGVAIIMLTLLIRILLSPLSRASIIAQKEMTAIQPEVKKLQEKHKHEKEEQMKKVMALYKERNINPLSGCLPLLIQLPIVIALYQVFLAGFNEQSLQQLYRFVPHPASINHFFIGFIDISKKNIVLAIVAGLLQFWQSKMILDEQKKHHTPAEFQTNTSLAMSKQMTYMMPVLTVFIAYSVHAGIALYWVVTTAFSIVQQRAILKK